LSAALARWWAQDPAPGATAVVGVDAALSPARWGKGSALNGSVAMLAPEDAFPAQAAPLRAQLPSFGARTEPAAVVFVVSAEAPGVLGRRLRAYATDPANSGKILAVVSLGGPVRADLPASLLSEGKLAAVGVAEGGPVGRARAVSEAGAWARAASSDGAKGKRPEELPGPFTWFY